jgi:hypothetical protein
MRIWSLHPKYLDSKGLTALWRETLLGKHVLENKTKGYKNHPQLIRFKKYPDPLFAINFYLREIYLEAKNRNYNYDKNKFDFSLFKKLKYSEKIFVNTEQVEYEIKHLLKKLKVRDAKKYKELNTELKKVKELKIKNKNPNQKEGQSILEIHPLFKIKIGGIEEWEIV